MINSVLNQGKICTGNRSADKMVNNICKIVYL